MRLALKKNLKYIRKVSLRNLLLHFRYLQPLCVFVLFYLLNWLISNKLWPAKRRTWWVDSFMQVKGSEHELFRHLPRKLWPSKVAISGRLLVDRPLQLQIPAEKEKKQMKKIRNNLEVNDSPVDKITFRKLEIEISEFINRKLKNPFILNEVKTWKSYRQLCLMPPCDKIQKRQDTDSSNIVKSAVYGFSS